MSINSIDPVSSSLLASSASALGAPARKSAPAAAGSRAGQILKVLGGNTGAGLAALGAFESKQQAAAG